MRSAQFGWACCCWRLSWPKVAAAIGRFSFAVGGTPAAAHAMQRRLQRRQMLRQTRPTVTTARHAAACSQCADEHPRAGRAPTTRAAANR